MSGNQGVEDKGQKNRMGIEQGHARQLQPRISQQGTTQSLKSVKYYELTG